ncbi:hypothetical protein MLD38_023874 [Melastoma candidum]|uniref:Uncharacterized protein n=1 Tax=Melastoma candidum TaxID=119954 RepID=A0ACB9NVI3_9MYRT|nr:hypothetical protein MLD38_023874 [Melastoma candidum]
MYPSSSSSQKSIQTTTASVSVAGLVRYGSAPSSFLSTAADSVVGGASNNMSSSPSTRDLAPAGSPMFPPPPRPLQSAPLFGNYYSGYSQPTTSKVNAPAPAKEGPTPGGGLHRAFGLTETGLGASPSSPASASVSLPRQSSSPAGFLSHLASENGMILLRDWRSQVAF